MKRLLAVLLSCALIVALAELGGVDVPHFKEAHAQSNIIGGGVFGDAKVNSGGCTNHIVLDSTTTAYNNSAPTGTPPSLTMTLATSDAADFLVYVIAYNGTNADYISTVTDNSGKTGGSGSWTRLAIIYNLDSSPLEVWYNTSSSTISSATLTVTWATGADIVFAASNLFAFNGFKTSTPLDPLSGGTGTGYVTSLSDPVSMTTTNACDAMVGTFRLTENSSSTAGGGWTLIIPTTNQSYNVSEYQSVTSAGPYSVTLGSDAGDSNGAVTFAVESR